MVCMAGHFKMASVLKLVMMENHATPDEVINEKSASHILHKQLLGAHEPNLLDEDDMHIFGSKPMADPLDLVCCDTCQKPVKASQYALHAERCSSRMVNPNSSMGLEEDTDPMEPPKKGRKIKLTGNGNKKVYIKVKAKSQSENKNTVMTNGNANKPLNSTADQRLKAATSYPEYHFRDMPAPLATKMYHSQGNYRLQFELGQLYRESCAEQSHNYASNTSPNSSQVNGLIPCDHSALHGSDNSVTHVSPNKFKPRTKHLDQLPATTSELCSGIPHQLSASGSSRLQASKSQRTDTRVSAVRNESARSRSNKAVVLSSKNTVREVIEGWAPLKTQSFRCFHTIQGIRRAVEARALCRSLGVSSFALHHHSMSEASWCGAVAVMRSQARISCQVCLTKGQVSSRCWMVSGSWSHSKHRGW